ncbi:hypothetical protein B0T21DRAFT_365283 [Apiosordaria backusii]|uniref:Uncharacterized protein n=1 Tax=Apiosordaria backusii TaxID=314023 RepID=A0AA40EIB1_9PEZI|nr:hypothetical protein B0T21DRAFT_365283 [Apiosordaria backusii]
MMSAYEDLYEPWSRSNSPRCQDPATAIHRRQPLGSPATSMPDPEVAVTLVPASRSVIAHEHSPYQASFTQGRARRARSRSTHRRSPSLGRSAQGPPPRRSVSSMKILFPLTLSPTLQTQTDPMDMSTTSNAESICSSASTNEMDLINNEPLADCNFPEMLVRDLETSEVVFRTKSMTAGCPSATFATSSEDEGGPQPGRAIARPPTPMYQFSTDKSRPNSVIASRPGSYDEPSDEEHAGERSESTASLSMGSEGMDPPPTIRMRGHSITTAATSVSGRRSSSFSQKMHWRSSPSTPPSSPAMTQTHHGTWFDADGEGDATINSRIQEPLHARQGRDAQSPVGGHSAVINTFSYNDEMTRHTEAIAYHLRPNSPNSYERPRTPSSQMSQLIRERPRIVNIPPTAIPKRQSSLNRGHIRTMSGSSMAPSVRGGLGRASLGQLVPSASMQVLGVRHGDRFGEISRPPSRGRDGDHVYTRRPDGTFFPDNLSENVFLDDDEEIRATGVYNQPLHTKQRTHSFSGRPSGSATTNLPEMQHTTHSTASYTWPGVPLPPDVLEVLRVSISCFPETMLTTSSLTIDNIRTYSKKLRHGGNPESDFMSDDRSLYSSTGSSLKPQSLRKWKLHWFGQSHKINKQQQHQRHQSQVVSRSSVDAEALATARCLRKTTEASWMPIRAIFPFGSDYLCDALYAHVLAFNYIGTLCPPPPRMSPLRSQASGSAGHRPSGSSLDDPSSKTRVPKKAASVLGMQDNNLHNRPTSPSGGPHHQRSRSRRFLRRDSHGRGSLRSRGSTASGFEGNGSSNGNSLGAPGMRELHNGLAKCIALLVSTLKKTETGDLQGIESGGDANTLLIREREVHDESGEVDVLLLRALCEVVRISEA